MRNSAALLPLTCFSAAQQAQFIAVLLQHIRGAGSSPALDEFPSLFGLAIHPVTDSKGHAARPPPEG